MFGCSDDLAYEWRFTHGRILIETVLHLQVVGPTASTDTRDTKGGNR